MRQDNDKPLWLSLREIWSFFLLFMSVSFFFLVMVRFFPPGSKNQGREMWKELQTDRIGLTLKGSLPRGLSIQFLCPTLSLCFTEFKILELEIFQYLEGCRCLISCLFAGVTAQLVSVKSAAMKVLVENHLNLIRPSRIKQFYCSARMEEPFRITCLSWIWAALLCLSV